MRSFFSVIFLVVILAAEGCSATKHTGSEEIAKAPNWKNLYYFHAGDSTWIVKPVTEAGSNFTGQIFNPDVIKKSRQVHVYAEPLSAVRIKENILTVPMGNIVKVENHKISPGVIIASAGFLSLLFLIPVIL
jgi:hypothetical protein